mmetsp:Transcript_9931/g.12508  ORF Transcript_9931/g.12508 Transcript_9931/m.12508 type:complete len:103 (-) Transcript_9931:316-624(-)
MRCDEQEGRPDCLVKEAVIVFPDTIIEPHAVVVKCCDALVAILAMHGVLVDVSLTDPAIFGLLPVLVVVISADFSAGVRCIIQVLVELWVDAVGLGSGVAVV